MKIKINLDTQSAAVRLVGLATSLSEEVYLTDGAHMCVSAKSMLGVICARFDFTEIWLITENDHYLKFKDFMSEE
jgi:hypothetical protein